MAKQSGKASDFGFKSAPLLHRPQTIRVLAHGHQTTLEDAEVAFHQSEYERLRGELQAAHDASQLPELPNDETRKALNELLVRVRLKN